MKTRTFVSILTLVLAILIVANSHASASNIEIFFQTVKSGDVAEVKRLIDEGADVNAQDGNGDTALILAAKDGRTEVVKLLIEAGADVNEWNKWHHTALFYAREHPDIFRLLKEAGARSDHG